MQIRALSVTQNIRGILCFTSLTLLILAIMSGCNSNQTNRNRNQPTVSSESPASPSPIYSPSPTGSLAPLSGDTIIVIKDGSADIQIVDHNKCTGATGQFSCGELSGVWIGETEASAIACPNVNADSHILIDTADIRRNIRVIGIAQQHKTRLTFDPNRFPSGSCTAPYEFCNSDNDSGVFYVRVDKNKPCRVCPGCKVFITQKP